MKEGVTYFQEEGAEGGKEMVRGQSSEAKRAARGEATG